MRTDAECSRFKSEWKFSISQSVTEYRQSIAEMTNIESEEFNNFAFSLLEILIFLSTSSRRRFRAPQRESPSRLISS